MRASTRRKMGKEGCWTSSDQMGGTIWKRGSSPTASILKLRRRERWTRFDRCWGTLRGKWWKRSFWLSSRSTKARIIMSWFSSTRTSRKSCKRRCRRRSQRLWKIIRKSRERSCKKRLSLNSKNSKQLNLIRKWTCRSSIRGGARRSAQTADLRIKTSRDILIKLWIRSNAIWAWEKATQSNATLGKKRKAVWFTKRMSTILNGIKWKTRGLLISPRRTLIIWSKALWSRAIRFLSQWSKLKLKIRRDRRKYCLIANFPFSWRFLTTVRRGIFNSRKILRMVWNLLRG